MSVRVCLCVPGLAGGGRTQPGIPLPHRVPGEPRAPAGPHEHRRQASGIPQVRAPACWRRDGHAAARACWCAGMGMVCMQCAACLHGAVSLHCAVSSHCTVCVHARAYGNVLFVLMHLCWYGAALLVSMPARARVCAYRPCLIPQSPLCPCPRLRRVCSTACALPSSLTPHARSWRRFTTPALCLA